MMAARRHSQTATKPEVIQLPSVFDSANVLPFAVRNNSRYPARSADSIARIRMGGAASGTPTVHSRPRGHVLWTEFKPNTSGLHP